jgi:hypothetical protein
MDPSKIEKPQEYFPRALSYQNKQKIMKNLWPVTIFLDVAVLRDPLLIQQIRFLGFLTYIHL